MRTVVDSSHVRRAMRDVQRTSGVERATRRALLYFVVPLWLGSGLADWWQHRRSHIERTAGAYESLIHLLMLAEAGVPSMLGLFLEINAGVLATAYAALAAHEVTAFWDVAYAEARRRVTPTEQHIHSYLEIGPLMAVVLLTVLHWEQARALVGVGPARAEFALRPKRKPLGMRYVVGLLTALTTCGALPYLEELWRCYRTDPSLAPRPEPPEPATPSLRIPA